MKYLIPCLNCGRVFEYDDPEIPDLSYREITFCSHKCGLLEDIKYQNEILSHRKLEEWEKWFYKRYHERLLENASGNNISE